MGKPITPIYATSRAESPEENLPPLCKEDFSGFSPEPFLGATAAATAIATGGTLTRVKALPSGETFQKVSASTSL